jgi:heterodisulfide reductase subunit B2
VKYTYFPGCSLKGTGKAFEESFLAVCKVLGLEMVELENWNCCGATAYFSVDETKALALASRNLAMAEAKGMDLVAPCAACYGVLLHIWESMEKYPKRAIPVKAGLAKAGLKYENKVKVRHPVDVLVNDVGIEAIKEKVKRSLKGLKIASYYGCRLSRPICTFDDPDNPTFMDQMMEATGATPVDYPLKTKCCGASHTGTMPEVGQTMSAILLREIEKRGADIITTSCPLCQFNLEVYQDKITKRFPEIKTIPVLHFTQVLGMAFGLSDREIGMGHQVISPERVFREKIGKETAGAAS